MSSRREVGERRTRRSASRSESAATSGPDAVERDGAEDEGGADLDGDGSDDAADDRRTGARSTGTPGEDDDGGEAGDRLPVKPSGPRVQPLLRYEQLPGELAEGLRTIVNRYELRTGAPLPKAVAVTSALAGEGVTTVSQALATMIAQEMGSFVCWVDCSWLSAGAAIDETDGRPNLLEMLADQTKIVSAFQSAPNLPNFMSLSPAPVVEEKRNMIVRSPEFEHLLEVLADEFDHVVYDIPPVLSNANGLALLRQADASLIVVRHRSTSVSQVRRAMEAIQPTPNLGVLLNRFKPSAPAGLRRLLGG